MLHENITYFSANVFVVGCQWTSLLCAMLRSIRRSDVYQTCCCRPRLVTAGLRQCRAGRLTSLPVQPPAVGTQRCCSIAGLRRSDHITDTLASFHWLKAPQRVQYKLATIVYRSVNGMAPHYLAADLRNLSDRPTRWRLRSSLTHQLDVRQSQCATGGDRTFAVASTRLWNTTMSATRHRRVWHFAMVLARTQNISLQTVLPLHFGLIFPRSPCSFYLGHVKNFYVM